MKVNEAKPGFMRSISTYFRMDFFGKKFKTEKGK